MTRPPTTTSTCPDCHAPVLTGLDHDTCGLPVTVDPHPLDQLGELLAVSQGRRTYEHVRAKTSQRGARRLEPRNAYRIGHDRFRLSPVLAEHRCHQPLPEAATVSSPVASWEESA